MAMSDRKIMAALQSGEVVIEPFRKDFLSTSSYDVCLGEYYYREQEPQLAGGIFNIYDQQQVQKVWGEVELAQPAGDVLSRFRPQEPDFKLNNIQNNDQLILLAPGETILAHTKEFIGGRAQVTSMMKARSSLGRSFILVCKCAGWGDVGYINRWTMEITNVSQHYTIPLVVGERIAQIIFYETGPILDKEYGSTGNYQNTEQLEQLMREWHASSMLPRTRRSPEI